MDGQKLGAGITIPNLVGIVFHSAMLLAVIFTFSRNSLARKVLIIFCVLQIIGFGFGMYSLRTARSPLGKATFEGYVDGYQEGQRNKKADPKSYALSDEKLNELWGTFEKEAWPKARSPLLLVIGIHIALYAGVIFYFTRPKIKALF